MKCIVRSLLGSLVCKPTPVETKLIGRSIVSWQGARIKPKYSFQSCHFSDDAVSSPNMEAIKAQPLEKSLPGLKLHKKRQHVNPLAGMHQIPIKLAEDWLSTAFENPLKPLIIDIGCGEGLWAFNMAKAYPQYNFLGLEIRKAFAEVITAKKQAAQLNNAHFLGCNANVDMDRLTNDIFRMNIKVEAIMIQFPDPLFKKRTKKRRVVNERMLDTFVRYPIGTKIFVQSDLREVVMEIVETITTHGAGKFRLSEGQSMDLETNNGLYSVLTERELSTRRRGFGVFKVCFERC